MLCARGLSIGLFAVFGSGACTGGNFSPQDDRDSDGGMPSTRTDDDQPDNTPFDGGESTPDRAPDSGGGCRNSLDCAPDQVCETGARNCVDCIDASDCEPGHECTNAECVAIERCKNSLDCPSDTVCESATGLCFECLKDADCNNEEACVEKRCRETCASDKQCTAQNLVCDADLAACVQCSNDSDCDADFHCADGNECARNRCPLGTSECLGSDIYECNGRDFVLVESCSNEQNCVDGDARASCVDWVCIPDSVECANDTLETCSSDGSRVEVEDCAAMGQTCFQSACASQACEPGTSRCEGSTRYECAADGLSESGEPCGAQQVCDPTVGQCILQLCTPNAPACNDNVATTCNGFGTGYVGEQLTCSIACIAGECADVLFFEDFEDGDLDGWQSRGGASILSVTSATAAAGTTYSARIDRNSNHHQGYYHLLPDIQPTYVSFWGRSATTELADTYFSLRQSNDADVLAIYFDNDEGGTFHASNGTTHWTIGSYEADVWYHFEYYIDWDNRTYNLDVDGVRLATGFGFQSTATSIGQIDIYNYRDSVGHWDEILMR